jgi:hypothetical protein
MSNSLDIFNSTNDEFDENLEEIQKNAKQQILTHLEPTIDEKIEVYKIIINYLKERKRKIYGGYAQHMLLKDKDSPIYTEEEFATADVDFYSPKPLEDLKNICDLLFDRGFKHVSGSEAMHKETYVIYVNYAEYCNISYVPFNIYNKIRFVEIEGMYITHPWFLMIDVFRIFSDPLVSLERIPKVYKRFEQLQKHYPLPYITKKLDIKPYKNNDIYACLNLFIQNYGIHQQTFIFTGLYVYNYYQHLLENPNIIKIPYYEIYSTDYISDGLDLIQFFENSNYKNKITYTEFYPFFQFLGNYTIFYYINGEEKIPILYLFSNNKKCMPYKKIDYMDFNNNNFTTDVKINIGSFDFNVLYILIQLSKVRVDEEDYKNDMLYKILNGLVNARTTYLKKNNLTIYNNTVFQSFIAECMGKTIQSRRESLIRRDIRFKLKKTPVTYRYEPSKSKSVSKFVFANSSGNKIKNTTHLQLIESKRHYNEENNIEDEEKNEHDEEEEEEENVKVVKKHSKKKN